MNEIALVAKPVEDLLDLIIRSLGLDLAYQVVTSTPDDPAREQLLSPELRILLSGPDASLLTAHNGELLHAIEHVAAKVLHLESDEHDRISLDADRFKAERDAALHQAAAEAVATVRHTGQPFAFPPMTSRERRILHLVLQASGLPSASSGENPRRFVVLYPKGQNEQNLMGRHLSTQAPAPLSGATSEARSHQLRSAFRPR